jgi:hypothetical protein
MQKKQNDVMTRKLKIHLSRLIMPLCKPDCGKCPRGTLGLGIKIGISDMKHFHFFCKISVTWSSGYFCDSEYRLPGQKYFWGFSKYISLDLWEDPKYLLSKYLARSALELRDHDQNLARKFTENLFGKILVTWPSAYFCDLEN